MPGYGFLQKAEIGLAMFALTMFAVVVFGVASLEKTVLVTIPSLMRVCCAVQIGEVAEFFYESFGASLVRVHRGFLLK